MKQLITGLFLFVISVTSVMGASYYFEINPANTNLTASGNFDEPPPLWIDVRSANHTNICQRYRIIVTKPQYDAGWAALPQVVKDTGKDDAKDYRGDYEKWGADKIALSDAMREVINELRVLLGQPTYSNGQWKQLMRDKKPKK